MRVNMVIADRVFRVIVAIAFGILYFGHFVPATLGILLLFIGAIFLATSALGFCPVYWMLGYHGKKEATK